MDYEEPELIFKVCLFFDNKVAKKLLTSKLFFKIFDVETSLTVGIDFYTRDVTIKGKFIRILVWDWRMEDQYKNLIPYYINGVNGVLLIYDMSNAKSLDSLSEWSQLIKNNLDYDPPILLVGNKVDLEEKREVSKEEVEKFKEKHDISSSMEISLKTGENVEEMFTNLTETLLKRYTPKVLEKRK